jgi:multiple sugar transport system substrate-binding protein
MNNRKILGATAAVVAAAISLTACGGSEPASQPVTGELNLRANKPWDFNSFSQASEKETGITLKSTQYSGEAYTAFIKQSFRTKESPGLFTWQVGGGMKELVDQNLLAETTDIWKKAVAEGSVPESVRELYTVNGKQYCAPITVDNWVMFYNKKIFDKHGLTPPKSWDELMQVASTLKQKGETPFWNQTNVWSFAWFQTILAGTDLALFQDLAKGKASYTDPRIVEVMNKWQDMQKKGFFNDPSSKDFARDQLRDGKVAMAPFGTWFTADAKLAGMNIGSDFGTFTIPAIKAQGKTPVAIETAPICTAESSPEKAKGLKYAEYWMSPKGQSAWVAQQGNLPYNPKATAPNPEMDKLGKEINSGNFEFYLRYYEATPVPIRTVALEQFSAFLTHGGDPVKYLTAIDTAAKSYWAGK